MHNISIGGSAGRYWTPKSVIVENAEPTKVVLTGLNANTNLIASDFTIAGFTISSLARDATNKILTLTLSAEVQYMDVLIVKIKNRSYSVTNNVVSYIALLTSTDAGIGVSTMRIESSVDITVTLGINAKFYTDAAGTEGESSTWIIVAGELRTIYLKCTTGTSIAKISDVTKIIKWGLGSGNEGWITAANSPTITFAINKLVNSTHIVDSGTSILTGAPPSKVTFIRLVNIVTWTYNGALPSGLTFLLIATPRVTWTYNGALPGGLTYILLDGVLIDWTGLDIGSGSGISNLNLSNYRIAKMSSTDMVTLLTSLTNRVGTLPATITINDYADYASPPTAVTDAVALLKSTKSITTVNLGA